jgi:hypothetical protein
VLNAHLCRSFALLLPFAIAVLSVPAYGSEQPAAPSTAQTRDDRETFLRKARILTGAPADGRTSWRAGLDDGTRRHEASVVTEDGNGPTRRNYKFNIAAYELDKLLGLNLVPPSVERSVNDRAASLIWWIDDFAMNELDRRRNRIDPPDAQRWDRQVQAVRLFDELISNTYRDTAPALYFNSIWDNLLITTDWTVWIIDHTGAFRTRSQLQDTDSLVRCPRSVLSRLRELNRQRLGQTLDKYLSSQQLDTLEVRRALLVRHFDRLIGTRGEAVVLYDLPPRQ